MREASEAGDSTKRLLNLEMRLVPNSLVLPNSKLRKPKNNLDAEEEHARSIASDSRQQSSSSREEDEGEP